MNEDKTSTRVARTPDFGVRGSSREKPTNLDESGLPRIRKREPREEPQTSKAEV